VLEPGERIAGRYRILRFIARGGMGEVYAAHDETLNTTIALKTLKPDVAEKRSVIERLRSEIQTARKVTHPNVCRIFDVGSHPVADGEPITFITMELLDGETLTQRILRGPIGVAEARRIVVQLAAALQAAHEAGVIHRDFKSANVILCMESSKGVRAVVTDFGLALPAGAGHSGGDHAFGTPEYMAPEQLEAQPLTPACDLYALGVVMFEIVTGVLPFPRADPFARLERDPPSPRAQVPELPERWDALIIRCLQKKPADRLAHASEVAAALEESAPITRPAPKQPARWVWLLAPLLIAVAVGVALRERKAPSPTINNEPAAATPVKRRRTVAVLGLKNLSGKPSTSWVSTALGEMLVTELAAGGELRVIPPDNVARMKLEMGWKDGDALSTQLLQRIRDRIAADLVVGGSYLSLAGGSGPRIRVDLRMQETNAGETVAAASETAAETELFEVVSRAGGSLLAQVGAQKPRERESGGGRAAMPSNPEAARLYAEGLVKLRLLDALAARELLEKAAAAEPAHPFVHSALSSAWSALGYDRKANDEAQRAFELSAKLPRAERLSIEGRLRETTPDWAEASRIYRALYSFYPDDLEYGLRLAQAETSGGHGKDALETLAQLRKLPAPAGEDPSIDLAEAIAGETLSDWKRERSAAATAAQKGTALGARLLVARARIAEGTALWNLADPKGSLAAYQDAQRISTEAGDRVGVARAIQQIATLRIQQGDTGAKKLFEEALAIYREIGDRRGEAGVLSGIATIVTDEDPEAAIPLYQQALATDRAIGDKRRIAVELNNLAVTWEQQRKLEQAAKNYQESAQVFREAGFHSAAGSAMSNLAVVLLDRGEVDRARDTVQEALQLARPTDSQPDISWALTVLGQVLRAGDDLPGARST
jgi:serine/threonine protein kinase/tetratricopeptide (TPR) repeat protein